MASRYSPSRSPPLRSGRRTPVPTSSRNLLPNSPLKTPPKNRTSPLPGDPNYSPPKTPPLFLGLPQLRSSPWEIFPELFTGPSSWSLEEPNFAYDLRLISSTLSPTATKSPIRPNIMVPPTVPPHTIPTTMEEVDEFLRLAWVNTRAAATSEYSSKLAQLHQFYKTKMSEIDAKEHKTLLENSSDGNQPGPSHMCDSWSEADIKIKSDTLRRRVKEETVQAILKLNRSSSSPSKQSHTPSPRQKPSNNSPSQQQASHNPSEQSRGKSPQKSLRKSKIEKNIWDSKAVDILNKWFDEHSDNPYPTKMEKEELAKRCKLSTKQVTNWFGNKRYHSNLTKKGKGKGKGKGSK